MSDFASLLERTRRAYAAVAKVESALKAAPSNRALQLSLGSGQKLAMEFEQQLHALAEQQAIDICRYRVVNDNENRYEVSAVSRSLEKFQRLFSLVYDAVVNGPKKPPS